MTPRIRVKELRWVRAGDILPNPRNWRDHPPEQIEGYKAIIDTIGVADVLLTRETEDGRLMLYDGHMRRDVDPDVLYPTIVTDLTESEAEQALLVIDPLAAMAQANADKLRALMERNTSDRPEIQRMMAALAERAGLYQSDGSQPQGDPGAQLDRAGELKEKWQVERGMVWQVGRHRVMCGDSYNSEHIARLMNGEIAGMLHTDPPYGINAVSSHIDGVGLTSALKNHPPGFARRGSVANKTTDAAERSVGATGATHRASRTAIIVQPNLYPVIEGDDHPFDPSSFIEFAPIVILWGANNYADKLPTSQAWIVWDKREDITRNDFSDCELAWCNKGKTSRLFHHLWNGLHKGSQHGERRIHPTEKPVKLFEEIGKMFCPDGLWVDLFAGSGAQLVAAERAGTTCYALEYEPLYVGCILQRLADMGLTPELAS